MSKKAKENIMSLPLDNSEQDEEILEIVDILDIMTLKIADNILQSFCQTKPSNFNSREKFVYSFINEEMELIDLANSL